MKDGIFDLTTPASLLEKLKHDHKALTDAESAYTAFNFFVTAEHLVDWLHPTDRAARQALRADPLLALVSHLANGAKHFGPLSKHHESVSRTGRTGGYFATSYFGSSYWGAYFGAGRVLSVTLDGPAAATFGPTITVKDLADRVLAYWDAPARVPR